MPRSRRGRCSRVDHVQSIQIANFRRSIDEHRNGQGVPGGLSSDGRNVLRWKSSPTMARVVSAESGAWGHRGCDHPAGRAH